MDIQPSYKTRVSVVNLKTHKKTDHDYYVGRPSVLGNPYTHLQDSRTAKYIVDDRETAISLYKDYFYDNLHTDAFQNEIKKIIEIYDEHGEVNLCCWCKPKSCHGDYIKEYIDRILKERKIKEAKEATRED